MSIVVDNLSLEIVGKKICENLNVEFKAGEFWAILGVNGVGKSTFLHHLIDSNGVQSKNICIDDIMLSDYKHNRKLLAKKTGILLQEYEYNFPCTVLEAALIGRHPHMSNWQWESDTDIRIAEAALMMTDLLSLKKRSINTLSGGEKRRLNLATLMVQDPDYFLLDEPTNHLDFKSQITILNLLKSKFSHDSSCKTLTKKQTGIMVIHDANLAYKYCDNVLLLYGNGKWASGKAHDLITADNLSHVYDCPFQEISNKNTSVFIPDQAYENENI